MFEITNILKLSQLHLAFTGKYMYSLFVLGIILFNPLNISGYYVNRHNCLSQNLKCFHTVYLFLMTVTANNDHFPIPY